MDANSVQMQLDERFPEGVKVTLMRGGDVPLNDDIILLTPRITSRQFGPVVVVDFEAADQSRSYSIGVEAVEEDPETGGLLVRTDEEGLVLGLSNQFSGTVRENLKQARSVA